MFAWGRPGHDDGIDWGRMGRRRNHRKASGDLVAVDDAADYDKPVFLSSVSRLPSCAQIETSVNKGGSGGCVNIGDSHHHHLTLTLTSDGKHLTPGLTPAVTDGKEGQSRLGAAATRPHLPPITSLLPTITTAHHCPLLPMPLSGTVSDPHTSTQQAPGHRQLAPTTSATVLHNKRWMSLSLC